MEPDPAGAPLVEPDPEDAPLLEPDPEEGVPGSESAPRQDRSPERRAPVTSCWSRRRPLLQLS